jgi:hypothetical protein
MGNIDTLPVPSPRTPENAPSVAVQDTPGQLPPLTAQQLESRSNGRRINGEGTRSCPTPTDAKKRLYLDALRQIPVKRHGCDVAGIHRSTPHAWGKADPAFAELEAAALADGVERLEADMFRRASGEESLKPSDLLTIFTMKAHKPELYRETVDHRVIGKVQHEIVIDLAPPPGPPPDALNTTAELVAGPEAEESGDV